MVGEWQTRFPFTGIRQATTAPQDALLHRAIEALEADDRISGAWLAGASRPARQTRSATSTCIATFAKRPSPS